MKTELNRLTRVRVPTAIILATTITMPHLANACMAIPAPASCSIQLGEKLKADLKQQHARIRQIEKSIRSGKRLLVSEVESLSHSPGVRVNVDLIADQRLRDAARAGTPIAFARRFEALRPKLSEKEWDAGVRLWANYIARSADLWEPESYEQYCDLQQEGQSLKFDAGYIFAWPFLLYDMSKGSDDTTEAAAVGVTVGPLITATGVVGLGVDVLTFIPNVAARGSERLRTDIHMKLSARAFRKFADFVVRKEKAHA